MLRRSPRQSNDARWQLPYSVNDSFAEYAPADRAYVGHLLPSRHNAAPPFRDRKFADSSVEGNGFEPVWGFSCQVVFWFVGGSLFGARKSFFVPSPAIRFAERAEGVKGPKR
jgi:hypothetical protein